MNNLLDDSVTHFRDAYQRVTELIDKNDAELL